MEIQCKFSLCAVCDGRGWDNSGRCHHCQEDDYKCFILGATITKRCEVSFRGDHKPGKSISDVTSLFFFKSIVYHLPRRLDKTFPKLRELTLNDCALKRITSADVSGLDHLERLDLENNQLKSLPDNLFNNTKQLISIRLNNNKLEYLSSRLFDRFPEHQLKLVSLRGNTNINASYYFHSNDSCSLKDLKTAIDSTCFRRMEDLEKMSVDCAITHLNEQNALNALSVGNLYNSKELVEASFSEIKRIFPNDVRSESLKHLPNKIKQIMKYKNLIDELNKQGEQ